MARKKQLNARRVKKIPFRILALPPEIRLMILRYFLSSIEANCHLRPSQVTHNLRRNKAKNKELAGISCIDEAHQPPKYLSLLLAHSTLHREAITLVAACVRFYIECDSCWSSTYLLKRSQFPLMKHITLSYDAFGLAFFLSNKSPISFIRKIVDLMRMSAHTNFHFETFRCLFCLGSHFSKSSQICYWKS